MLCALGKLTAPPEPHSPWVLWASPQQHCWYLGLVPLCWGPVVCIQQHPWPLPTRWVPTPSIPASQSKMSPDLDKCPLGSKITPEDTFWVHVVEGRAGKVTEGQRWGEEGGLPHGGLCCWAGACGPPIINALGRRTRAQGLHPPRWIGGSCTCLTHSLGLCPCHLWVPSLVQERHKALAELSGRAFASSCSNLSLRRAPRGPPPGALSPSGDKRRVLGPVPHYLQLPHPWFEVDFPTPLKADVDCDLLWPMRHERQRHLPLAGGSIKSQHTICAVSSESPHGGEAASAQSDCGEQSWSPALGMAAQLGASSWVGHAAAIGYHSISQAPQVMPLLEPGHPRSFPPAPRPSWMLVPVG